MIQSKILAALIITLLAITGCADKSGNVYSPDQAQTELTVQYGTLLSTSPVTIKHDQTGLGALGGIVTGGIVGSTMGRSTGRTLAILGGVIVGGLAGTAAESALQTRDGLELTIQLDDGKTIAIVQESGGETFTKGERVRVLRAQDGSTRVRKQP